MAIVIREGDTLADPDAVCKCVTINCVGTLGKGIALSAKRKYKGLNTVYQHMFQNYMLKVGRPSVVNIEGELLLLFPTKHHWCNPSKYEWIEAGLDWMVDNYPDKELRGIDSIALPPLGCGNGWLHWPAVRNMIFERFKDHDMTIYLYPPPEYMHEGIEIVTEIGDPVPGMGN